ncbi:MAG: DUF3277 family protein [Ruminococcus sp.]|nr:DUF3277 family protein [Ruminococcus sp.]
MSTVSSVPVVFDPSQTTITVDNMYVTGLGESAISFDYSQDAASAASGLDGAVVFEVNNAKLGTCTLPLKVSSPQFEKLMEMAKNHTMFSIWCTDKSVGRRAGSNYAMFTRIPTYTADSSDVEFSVTIADLDIGTC